VAELEVYGFEVRSWRRRRRRRRRRKVYSEQSRASTNSFLAVKSYE
jgi:hypothetical protein